MPSTAPMLTLEAAFDTYLSAIEAALTQTPGDGLLETMSQHHLGSGGKRLRALIPPWLCQNLGGKAEDALPLGLAAELLHNGTLVHDDLQDGDRYRRGLETIWVKWGDAQAINVGDALYFHALDWAGRSPAAGSIISPIGQALYRVVRGQVMEMQLQLPPEDENHLPATLETWMEMATGKTGALFGLCLRAGAVAAGRHDLAEDCQAFGEALGLLFQVQDDYLDLVGDKGRDMRGSDLAEGKLSFPVILAMGHSDKGKVRALLDIVHAPREACPPEKVAEGLALLEAVGALEQTAIWLKKERDRLRDNPINGLLPGLLERILAPVAHAL